MLWVFPTMRIRLRPPPLTPDMDQCRSRPKLLKNFQDHWSIPISGEIHMDQSLVHTFSWGNSYGPMVLKVLQKFRSTLALVHGWLFPVSAPRMTGRRSHWTERGDDNIFLHLAIVVRLFLFWLRTGSLSWHPLV